MSWRDFINQQSKEDYFQRLQKLVVADAKDHIVYPKHQDIFNAFRLTPIDKVKVLWLGADPYINEGQAHGLAFSVQDGVDIPPSLRNIYKELQSDLDIEPPKHGNLTAWGKQGVLLLNSILTVRAGESASHKGFGWEIFSNNAISFLSRMA